MWVIAGGAFLLQWFGFGTFSRLCGLVSFGLAVFLVSRPQKAARLHGWLRLLVAALGALVHLVDARYR